jgi:hypothetical protein
MDTPRLQKLAPKRFVSEFMAGNRPVVVTDALEGWQLAERWTPATWSSVSAKSGSRSTTAIST